MPNSITLTPTVLTNSQYAGANEPYVIDVSQVSAAAWQPGIFVAAGEIIRPTTANQTGFVYQADADGQTGLVEPAWAKTVGGTVTDGSITWTAAAPPAQSQDQIAAVVWSVSGPDSALQITSQVHDALTASAYIGGGTSGAVYTVEVTVTMNSGAAWIVVILVTVL